MSTSKSGSKEEIKRKKKNHENLETLLSFACWRKEKGYIIRK